MSTPNGATEHPGEQLPSGWSQVFPVRNWLPILGASIALTRLVAQVLAESRQRRLTSADWTGVLSRIDETLREVLRRTGSDLPAVRLVTFQDLPKPPRRKRRPKALPAE
jgi:hypothetical protein